MRINILSGFGIITSLSYSSCYIQLAVTADTGDLIPSAYHRDSSRRVSILSERLGLTLNVVEAQRPNEQGRQPFGPTAQG
jgi:hypothetical protein